MIGEATSGDYDSFAERLHQDTLSITGEVLQGVTYERVKSHLNELASLNGTLIDPTEGHPAVHYSTNRVALTEFDTTARSSLIEPWMEEAGMEVEQNPLAVIGRMKGEDPDLPPLVILSHVDTVPKGDMYDGTLGVLAGIEFAKSISDQGLRPSRDLLVVALTGEESTAFGFPLFGSRALFHGLTEKELATKGTYRADSLGSALDKLGGHSVSRSMVPIFGEGTELGMPVAALEVHVEQGSNLENAGVEIGIVDVIAAAERYNAAIGDTPLVPDDRQYEHDAYFELHVAGSADHSGTTPMDERSRADGLLATAELLQSILAERGFPENAISIGDITVDGGSMNKIPGLTTSHLRIASDDGILFKSICDVLESTVVEANAGYAFSEAPFPENPIELVEVEAGKSQFFRPEDIASRQEAAFYLIRGVNDVAREFADRGVVGTVGKYETSPDGSIGLSVDIRGTDLAARDEAIATLKRVTETYGSVSFGEPISGSGEPVVMDGSLRALAEHALDGFGISSMHMPSLAGHDIQNVGRAGIPSMMLFCQSNNGGKAHNPEAYTAPEHVLNAVYALSSVATPLLFSREV
ncbi:MAG: M20/M25/M40 family metallo-hydrolase [Candidatus Saccharimonadales bacterium]